MPDVCGQRLDHVMASERKVWTPDECLQPRGHAAGVVVVDDEVDFAAGGARVVPVQDRLHEVVAEESRAAGHQEAPAGHGAELGREVRAYGVQILIEELPQSDQSSV